MATAADKEIKQLNKTVTEAVNMLKVYYGNSAQMKNMNEKQREAISKWFEVVDEADTQQKRQRAFVERERDEKGRFFTKQVKQQETSNKKFLNMAQSVGGMFKNMTSKVSTGLSNLASGIMQRVSNVFQAIKSQFLSLFGEESEWFDLLSSIKDSVMGFAGWFAKGFSMIFRRTPAWAGKQIKLLKDMYKLQVKQMKMDFLDAGGKKEGKTGIMGILGALVFAIGAAIGSFMHRYFVLITKLPIFQRVAQWFTKLDDIPFIGKLFKAIKFGFKWLGWPLTIILSVIDFIRGYSEAEGSMFEKIKEGLWKALEGFIELPVMFLGWVIEKVLGFFGVEVEGIGNDMLKVIKDLFFMAIDGWVLIFGLVKDGIVASIEGVKNIWNKIKDPIAGILSEIFNPTGKWAESLINAITPIVAGVHNFFVDFWNSVVTWIQDKVPDWMPGRDKIFAGLKSMEMSRMEVPAAEASPVDASVDLQKKKIEEQKKQDDGVKKALEDLDKSVKDSGKQTSDSINAAAVTNNQAGAGGGDTEQIPDEVDNMGMIMFNTMF
jgi:hypothetical protein